MGIDDARFASHLNKRIALANATGYLRQWPKKTPSPPCNMSLT